MSPIVPAVGAFTVLQVKARSRRRRPPSVRRRRYDPSDWRALPPQYWAEGRDDEAPSGNEESYRPDWRYGYPPGYEPNNPYRSADRGVAPPRAVRDDATRGWGIYVTAWLPPATKTFCPECAERDLGEDER